MAFIANDKLVVSLKGGELYVLTLFVDSMRSVRSFHFDKAASSVLTSCVSTNILCFSTKIIFQIILFVKIIPNHFLIKQKLQIKAVIFSSMLLILKKINTRHVAVNLFSLRKCTEKDFNINFQ